MSKQRGNVTPRREFLSNTGRAAAGLALTGVAVPPVHAGEDNTIRLALIGCGGRGRGAVANAMSAGGLVLEDDSGTNRTPGSAAGGPIKLVAMADLRQDRLDQTHKVLSRLLGKMIDVPEERRFLGFDGYRHAMDCLGESDVAILTTHAAFRAPHLEYAIEKGVNVFMEKDFAADPGGIKRMIRAGEAAKKKDLKIGAGLMCRHSSARQAMIQQIRDGAMGDIPLIRAYRMDPGYGMGPFPRGENELLWQLSPGHPYQFMWSSGGIFIELMIHQIDECFWIKDSWPISAHGVGGRYVGSTDCSQNLDSYSIEYTFADQTKAMVTGQSNADGRGRVNVTLADSNPFVGVKYQGETWSRGDDPSDHSGKHASPWPIVLDTLIPEQKVPMGFVQAAVGSTVVRQWRKEGQMYQRAMTLLHKATDGGMAVKAVLYYQGENDITHYNKLSVLGDYRQYKTHLAAMVADFHNDLKAPVLVGQITNLLTNRSRNDGVRRAQQEIWSESPHSRPGGVTYDILPTDGVHYRDAVNMRVFADRWTYAIRNALYSHSPQRPPQLIAVTRTSDTDLQLTYDRLLSVSDWRGRPSRRPAGFRVVAGDISLADKDINSASVHGKTVLLRFNLPVPAAARFFYGSGVDAQNKPVLRDPETGQPAPLRFDVPIQ